MSEEREAPARPAAAAEDSVGRNTLFSFMTQMVTAAGTAVLTIYLVRTLGPSEYGLFALAVGVSGLLMIPSDFGITQSASRFIAERRGDDSAVAAVLSDAARLKLMIGAVFAIALCALASPIANAYGEPALAWPIRWISIVVVCASMMSFYRYAFSSLRRVRTGFKIVAAESFAETVLSLVIVILAGGAAAAAAGRAAGFAFGLLVALVLTHRAFGRRAFARHSGGDVPRSRLMRYAGALLIIDAAFALSAQSSPLMIGAFLGATSVGIYQAPAKLIVFLQYPGIAIANAVTPGLARVEGREPDVEPFKAALRHIIVFQALLMAPVVVWAEPITDLLLGPGYERSADVLRALAPYIFTAGIAPIVALGVNYLGEARLRLPISIADVILELALTAFLLSQIGLLGAAYASDISALVYVPLHLWILRRLIDLPLRPLALSMARSLLAAGAMAAVLFAFGTDELSLLGWIGGSVGGLAAFVAVLLLTRQVTVGELRALGRFVRRRLPGGAGR